MSSSLYYYWPRLGNVKGNCKGFSWILTIGYYLWHIKKEFAEKLSHVYFKKSRFKIWLKKCIMSTYKIKELEKTWKSLIIKDKLENNEWLNHLYKICASWVPIYNRFFYGMNTTGWCEGINSFFNGFVTSSTILESLLWNMRKHWEGLLKK